MDTKSEIELKEEPLDFLGDNFDNYKEDTVKEEPADLIESKRKEDKPFKQFSELEKDQASSKGDHYLFLPKKEELEQSVELDQKSFFDNLKSSKYPFVVTDRISNNILGNFRIDNVSANTRVSPRNVNTILGKKGNEILKDSEEIEDILFDESDSDPSTDYNYQNDYESSEESEDGNDSYSSNRHASNHSFAWKKTENFIPHNYKFDSRNCGINNSCNVDEHSTPYQYFRYFCSDSMVELIVNETNKFFKLKADKKIFSPHSNAHDWKDVTGDEIMTFLGLTLLMTHCKKARLVDYWSTSDLIETRVFGKYMSRNRYRNILSFLHFADNTDMTVNEDRLGKIRPILKLFQNAFGSCLYPFQKLVIDEFFKQYIPSNRHRMGIKLFILCDCLTGIVLDFIVYSASDVDIKPNDPLGISGAVVKKLMSPYLNKGFLLYTDNKYTSPLLSMYLHEQNTGSCGTVRSSKKNMPKFELDKNKKWQCMESGALLAGLFHDKRDVCMLSTIHEGKMINYNKRNHITDEIVKKPDVILDYNKNMRLVDKSDMQINAIGCLRKTMIWYINLFFHLIDISLLNAHHLYSFKTGKKLSMREFSLSVIHEILQKHAQVTNFHHRKPFPQAPDHLMSANYISRHHLALITTDQRTSKKIYRYCYVCYNATRRSNSQRQRKRKMVAYCCQECRIPLCVDCFRVYHTEKKFYVD